MECKRDTMKRSVNYFVLIMSSLFGQVDYYTQIQTIFNDNCTNCHINGGAYYGGLDLVNYDSLMIGSNNGDVIVPGDHASSILWQKVNSGEMPPYDDDDLNSDEIDLIAQWIDEGALEIPTIGYSGPIWYVATTGSDETGDGSDDNPFISIQKAIDASNNADTVLVSPGIYCGSIDFVGKNIVVGSHYIIDHNDSIIDSTILGPGNPYDYYSDCGDYFGGVQFISGEDSTAHFTGFTITGTFGTAPIKCVDSSPSLSYLRIRNNHINTDGGGALHLINSQAKLKNLIINGNNKQGSSNGGAAMFIDSSIIFFSNSLVYNNSAIDLHHGVTMYTYTGGIVAMNNSILNLNNISFHGNSGTDAVYYEDDDEPFGYGSALHLYDSSNATLINSIIWNEGDLIIGEPEQVVGSVDISFSNILGGWEGSGNIDHDPLFCNPDSNDFTLAENSPCVGSGEDGINMGALGIGCEGILSIDKDVIPLSFTLHQNYPNPFNPITTIQYYLPEDAFVNITIYNMLGRIVSNLVSLQQSSGYKSIEWDATNSLGQPVSAGLYLYSIDVGWFRQTKKMILLK